MSWEHGGGGGGGGGIKWHSLPFQSKLYLNGSTCNFIWSVSKRPWFWHCTVTHTNLGQYATVLPRSSVSHWKPFYPAPKWKYWRPLLSTSKRTLNGFCVTPNGFSNVWEKDQELDRAELLETSRWPKLLFVVKNTTRQFASHARKVEQRKEFEPKNVFVWRSRLDQILFLLFDRWR